MTDQPRPQLRYKTGRLHVEAVCDALRSTFGLVEPAARLLQMDGANLRKYVRTHPRCVTVQIEARQKLGDLAESKLVSLVQAGDYRAIALVLTTLCKGRGYTLPKGSALNTEAMANVKIGSVNILPIKSGEYVGGPEIELDGRSVMGGRIIEPDDEEPNKLN
jgi:hypothetical protein